MHVAAAISGTPQRAPSPPPPKLIPAVSHVCLVLPLLLLLLCSGCQVRPPMPPVYLFVIDVSAAAFACGMVSVVAHTIKDCLDQLPGDERTLVGFITYDVHLHFYNLKANLAAPQVRIVSGCLCEWGCLWVGGCVLVREEHGMVSCPHPMRRTVVCVSRCPC